MRIQNISYVVKVGKASHVVTMTRVVGLKLRELVPVRRRQEPKAKKQ